MNKIDEVNAKIEQNAVARQAIITEGENLLKEKEALEVVEITYSIGDRFNYGARKFLLVGFDVEGIALVGLSSGELYCDFCKVKDIRKVTQKEWNKLCCQPSDFIRYWDNRKQVLIKT